MKFTWHIANSLSNLNFIQGNDNRSRCSSRKRPWKWFFRWRFAFCPFLSSYNTWSNQSNSLNFWLLVGRVYILDMYNPYIYPLVSFLLPNRYIYKRMFISAYNDVIVFRIMRPGDILISELKFRWATSSISSLNFLYIILMCFVYLHNYMLSIEWDHNRGVFGQTGWSTSCKCNFWGINSSCFLTFSFSDPNCDWFLEWNDRLQRMHLILNWSFITLEPIF